MKNRIVLIALLLPFALNAQVFLRNFESDISFSKFAQKFTIELSKRINRAYYLIPQSQQVSNLKAAREVYDDYLQEQQIEKIKPEFFYIAGSIVRSREYSVFFDLNVRIINETKGEVFAINEKYIKEEDISILLDNLIEIIYRVVPTYMKPVRLEENRYYLKNNYGEVSKKNLRTSIWDTDGNFAAEGEVYEINNDILLVDVKALNRPQALPEISSIVISLKENDADIQEFTNRIEKLRQAESVDIAKETRELEIQKNKDSLEVLKEQHDYEIDQHDMSIRENRWVTLSLQNLSTQSDNFKNYFSKLAFNYPSPPVFCIKVDFNKYDLHWFLKGRVSTNKTVSLLEQVNGESFLSKSKFNFFEVGIGIENTFYIFKAIQPSFGAALMFDKLTINRDVSLISSQVLSASSAKLLIENNPEHFNGVSGEVFGSLTIKIKAIGIYGEVGMKTFPFLKSEINKNSKINFMFFCGLGLGFYF